MRRRVAAKEVHSVLSRHLLVEGYPFVVDLQKSHGPFLVDARSGDEYFDFTSMFASLPLGMNHPKILAAKERLASVALHKPTSADDYTVEMAEFVKTFFEAAVPGEFKHVFFIEGGTLGVENALKAAIDWKVRKNFERGLKKEKGKQVVHFEQAFHGRSGYALSLTNTFDPRKHMYFPKFVWPRVLNPKMVFPVTEANLKSVEKAEKKSLEQIKKALSKNKDDIAAVILEPIQAEGGDNHFRPEFFAELRTLCDENETMLIFDEIQTGMGMTGKFWAWQHLGVAPDLMSFGKKAQVCGFLSGKRIDEVEKNVFRESTRIDSTWGGNLVDMVRATIYLEAIEEEGLLENARRQGAYLLRKLEELQKEFPRKLSQARGLGLLCAIDLSSTEKRNLLIKKALDHRLVLLGGGEKTIRFRPPLTISKSEIDFAIGLIRKLLS